MGEILEDGLNLQLGLAVGIDGCLWQILYDQLVAETVPLPAKPDHEALVHDYQTTARWPKRLKACLYERLPGKEQKALRLRRSLGLPAELAEMDHWLQSHKLGPVPAPFRTLIK